MLASVRDQRRSRATHNAHLASFFRERPNFWIDSRTLGEVAGFCAWRSRVSDLRRPPFNLTIENRQRRVLQSGRPVIVSEYRFVPAPPGPRPQTLLGLLP